MIIALDFDGTLVDCRRRQVECMASIFNRRRMFFDRESFWYNKREGGSTFQTLMQTGLSSEQAKEISTEWVELVESPYWLGYDQVLAGVNDALKDLCRQGAALFLVTARKDEKFFLNQVRILKLDQYFSGMFCVRPTEAASCKAEILATITPKYFIGDTESDLNAAEKCGTDFVAVSCGQRSHAFMSLIAQPVFRDLPHFLSTHEL